MPDATYTSWDTLDSALKQALAQPLTAPIVPSSVFAPYAQRPLVGKLGIKAGMSVALREAPPGFRETLGELPADVTFRDDLAQPCDLVIWFVRARAALEGEIAPLAEQLGHAPLWIVWPKRASQVATDLSQPVLRPVGLR